MNEWINMTTEKLKRSILICIRTNTWWVLMNGVCAVASQAVLNNILVWKPLKLSQLHACTAGGERNFRIGQKLFLKPLETVVQPITSLC